MISGAETWAINPDTGFNRRSLQFAGTPPTRRYVWPLRLAKFNLISSQRLLTSDPAGGCSPFTSPRKFRLLTLCKPPHAPFSRVTLDEHGSGGPTKGPHFTNDVGHGKRYCIPGGLCALALNSHIFVFEDVLSLALRQRSITQSCPRLPLPPSLR